MHYRSWAYTDVGGGIDRHIACTVRAEGCFFFFFKYNCDRGVLEFKAMRTVWTNHTAQLWLLFAWCNNMFSWRKIVHLTSSYQEMPRKKMKGLQSMQWIPSPIKYSVDFLEKKIVGYVWETWHFPYDYILLCLLLAERWHCHSSSFLIRNAEQIQLEMVFYFWLSGFVVTGELSLQENTEKTMMSLIFTTLFW